MITKINPKELAILTTFFTDTFDILGI